MIAITIRLGCGHDWEENEMGKKGGSFVEEPTLPVENGYFEKICPQGGDLRFMMSGRCGIYYCLEDIARTDRRKVAYVPRYTCETVLAPFAKAGYQLRFYGIDRDMGSVFDPAVLDEISVLSLCGYFGFCNYDRDFVRACHERGVVIFEDVTHSLFSEGGIDPLCDYWAGSFRKWMGVSCGGFAVKRRGVFAGDPLPVHPRHLELRQALAGAEGHDLFWEGEMLLRQIFDSYGGDPHSEYVMRHADLEGVFRRRRENYSALLERLPAETAGFRPVFPVLPEGVVPCNFTVYADDRDHFSAYLAERGIRTTAFWPVGPLVNLEGCPDERYIYDHVLSIPCDQRRSVKDMDYVARALAGYPGPPGGAV